MWAAIREKRWVRVMLAVDAVAVVLIAVVLLDFRDTGDDQERALRNESGAAAHEEMSSPQEFQKFPESNGRDNTSTSPQPTNVLNADAAQGPVIRYTGSAFIPSSVRVESGPNRTGCFVTFINDSAAALLLRLAPYDPADKYGYPYSAIAPGDSGIIDPRYRGIPDPEFYDRNNRAASITVHLLPTCQL